MKVSDYVASFLTENGIKNLFLISGGGIMHLLDSVANKEGLNLVFNLNEQATGICADSYAQYTNHLGACLVTTGPGATNAITGCAGAWLDSSPVLFISGQTKTEDMGQLKGLRQYGAQEIAIVPMVKPITKYAVIIMKAEEIRYHLEKAVYLATHGRKGPVWIDIPLDIQGSQVEVENLKGFDAESEGLQEVYTIEEEIISQVYELINMSERPVVLMGHGVTASGKGEKLRGLLNEFKIPVLATWRAKGIYGDEDELFMGLPGIPAMRYSNYVLQNSDFLLIIGSRLNPAITAYAQGNFAPKAVKVIIDIDSNEINKSQIPFALKINTEAGAFTESLIDNKEKYINKSRVSWSNYCVNIKEKYPLSKEIQPINNEGKVDGYMFAEKLSDYMKMEDVFIGSSSGRTCGISHMAIKLKQGQKFITSMGIGSMGWCLPSAISSCIASCKRRTIVFEGDGSLQHNIQELALINTYKLPIKIFIYSNSGYSSIYTMQKNNFNSNFAGCTKESGVHFPNIESIAKMYNLKYYVIRSNSEIDQVMEKVMRDDTAVLCEVQGSINFDEIPKSQTIVNNDGTLSSSRLEYLYPFIDIEDHNKSML
jgi:acetolactate synthase-1/2/3 large subunit